MLSWEVGFLSDETHLSINKRNHYPRKTERHQTQMKGKGRKRKWREENTGRNKYEGKSVVTPETESETSEIPETGEDKKCRG